MSPGPLPGNKSFCDLDTAKEQIDCFFVSDPALLAGVMSLTCRVRQVHGKDLLRVRPELIRSLAGSEYVQYPYDGLMTDEPGLVMTVYSADCLPILLYDPVKRVVAAIHAGWKGTLFNICGAAIEEMEKHFQCKPSEIRVTSGPAIQACCFDIKEDVALLFRRADPSWEDLIISSEDKMRLNLHEINRRQLLKNGVLDSHVAWSEACTFCHADLLPSFRREKGGNRRIISGIGLRNDGQSKS
ncbi:MAG: peptidoglycan editing factor PgeF [Nitrospirae bacterium]|nr:peptidoglycan editing factor PgeF [Nitrospirota bacterium]MBI3593842.1 peptidoglycan editing factor PgeF [Nitrospirota bacterium]